MKTVCHVKPVTRKKIGDVVAWVGWLCAASSAKDIAFALFMGQDRILTEYFGNRVYGMRNTDLPE